MVIKEIEQAQAHFTADYIDYKADSVIIKTILKKTNCDISIIAYDAGTEQEERKNTFESFAQIVEGHAVFVIDGISHIVETGQCILIPAHSPNTIVPNGRFKMMLTVIKEN
jgi:quercetin dioxygenase-like cupin family protein